MKRKIISMVLAACLVFGSAAALPQGAFTDNASITASADTKGDFTYVLSANGKYALVTKYNNTSNTTCTIPDKLGDVPVEVIGQEAFKGKTKLKTVTVPTSLRVISNSAFENCTALTVVDGLRNTQLTSVGDYAFKGCSAMKNINFPKTLETIYLNAFENCSSMESVIGLQNTKLSGQLIATFKNCKKLNYIEFPEGVTYMESTFQGCTALYGITLPNSVTTVGAHTFDGCSNLTYVTMPSNLETLGAYAFYDCAKLQGPAYMLKDTKLKTIGTECFSNCTQLTKLFLPSTATDLSEYCYGFKRYKFQGSWSHWFLNDPARTILLYKGGKAVETAYRTVNKYWYDIIEKEDMKTKFEYIECTNHDYVGKVTTQPTCTEKGTTTYTCNICGDSYTKQDVPAKGHSWKAMYYWDVNGNNKKCTMKLTCQNDSSHTDSKTVIPTYKIIEKPTTMASGTGRYYADFGSPWGVKTHDVDIASVTVEWENPIYTWSSDKKSCTAKRTAYDEILDKHYEETEKAAVVYVEVTVATCEKGGKAQSIANFNNLAFDSQIIESETPAKGHIWSAPTYTWSADNKTCTATTVCANDKSHKQSETVTATYKETKAPTTTATGVGTYTATFKNSLFKAQTKNVTLAKKTEPEKKETGVKRIAGSNRFATAAEISKASFKTANTVVLAYGLNYADALAGVTLANKLNAPILLTHTAKLPDETQAEIKRLGAKKVIILGGTGAISKDVEDSLKKQGLTTERKAGTTRFGTATAIAQTLNDKPTDVFFVYAFNYADALSVSTVAALKNAPIIYLKTNGELDDDTAKYLKSIKGSVKNAYVIGGEGVISKDMLNKAGAALGVTPTRVAGKNRYATCVEVNNKFKSVLTGSAVCVAKGLDFPDALAGGVFAAQQKTPLFLADNTLKDEQKTYLKGKKSDVFYVFGGTGAVPDKLVTEITTASK